MEKVHRGRLFIFTSHIILISQAINYQRLISSSRSFIAIVWPITPLEYDAAIENVFERYGEILYKEKQIFTRAEATCLLRMAHPHILALREHVNWYFPPGTFEKPARIYILKFKNVDDALKAKHKIRKFCNLQYRAVHINDTHAETVELAHFLFARHTKQMLQHIRLCKTIVLPLQAG